MRAILEEEMGNVNESDKLIIKKGQLHFLELTFSCYRLNIYLLLHYSFLGRSKQKIPEVPDILLVVNSDV